MKQPSSLFLRMHLSLCFLSVILYIITQLALISLQYCNISTSVVWYPLSAAVGNNFCRNVGTFFLGLLHIKEHFLGCVRHFHSSDIKQMA